MKRLSLFIIIGVTAYLLFYFVGTVQAQVIKGFPLPGIDCGNSEATDSAQKTCCKKETIFPENQIGDYLKKINTFPAMGWLGDLVNNIIQPIFQLEKTINPIPCPIGYPSDINSPSCTCISADKITPSPIAGAKTLCEKYISNPKELSQCTSCANSSGIWTAVGCVYGDVSLFIQNNLLGWGIGLAGITALLCMIYGSLMMQTSRGNAEKIKKAQELITSCVMGLMLIIFSVLILRIIGVDILKIPGFK